jgi:nicotinamide phosphoribosyltransferase
MKCSAVCIDGVWHDVSKQPVTDPGKGSKRGRFALIGAPGGYQTVPPAAGQDDLLQAVYRDGQILLEAKFSQVRARAAEAATRLAG